MKYLTIDEKKSYTCAPLLPAPVDVVVREHLKTINELREENEQLKSEITKLKWER